MRFVFASYIVTHTYNDPKKWIKRIRAYGGVLEALGVNNQVISMEQINYDGEYFKNNVAYKFIPVSKFDLYFPFKQHRYIKRLKPDVVFIQSLHFPFQVILLRLMLGRKVKIMVQNHAEEPFAGIKKNLLRFSEKYVNAYLFVSKNMGLNWVAKGNLTSPKKIHEVMELSSIFYPVDRKVARERTGITETDAFLWVGRLNANKDPLTVIKAFLKFAAQNAGACLYMLYHTEDLLPEIKVLLSNAPNAAAIKLVGNKPNGELLYWYNSVDFVVSGSHYEGAGTAVCEAMSCGCVPVITDIFSFRMMTDNGAIGLLYKPGNEPELLATLIKTHQIDIEEQRNKALAYFKSRLSFEAIAQDIQDIAASC
jgi:glycosyltransferase involved in cell wall biosynthesis